jgi:hypothetical protein
MQLNERDRSLSRLNDRLEPVQGLVEGAPF